MLNMQFMCILQQIDERARQHELDEAAGEIYELDYHQLGASRRPKHQNFS